jgi:hypothetical protein
MERWRLALLVTTENRKCHFMECLAPIVRYPEKQTQNETRRAAATFQKQKLPESR